MRVVAIEPSRLVSLRADGKCPSDPQAILAFVKALEKFTLSLPKTFQVPMTKDMFDQLWHHIAAMVEVVGPAMGQTILDFYLKEYGTVRQPYWLPGAPGNNLCIQDSDGVLTDPLLSSAVYTHWKDVLIHVVTGTLPRAIVAGPGPTIFRRSEVTLTLREPAVNREVIARVASTLEEAIDEVTKARLALARELSAHTAPRTVAIRSSGNHRSMWEARI